MVKVQQASDYEILNKHYLNMIDRMGKSYSFTIKTPTSDSMGNLTGSTDTTSTIKGDFQVIEDEFKIQKLGFGGLGVAKFYGRASDSLTTGGQITISSENVWELRKRVEDDEWTGVEVASVWIAIRLDG